MRVTLLGTGTSMPDPERVQSGIMIQTESHVFLIDLGSGVLQRLVSSGIDITKIQHVFISHFHVDHCSDFPTFCQSMWLAGFNKTLHLYAPPQVDEWSKGVREIGYPYLLEKLDVEIHHLDEKATVMIGNCKITTTPTTHGSMDTRAFKMECSGKSIVYSSDTAPSSEIVDLAKDTDLLIHECNWLDGEYPKKVHTSPSELHEVISKATPKRVVVTHVSPQVVENWETVKSIISHGLDVDALLGEDLLALEVL
ncbi:MAG: MBL fold metallo-hydrolase [Candidatus Lokiarchaeota archaeon]|nr:MBL fold metallo-hydrolase [Candidatus Lokiarchaeota archaeon]